MGKKLKKVVAALLCMGMVMGMMSGCSGKSGSDSADTSEDTADTGTTQVVVGVAESVSALDPWGNLTVGNIAIMPVIYQSLFAQNEFSGELVPCLGESYEMIDGSTYRVKLFEDIYDSAGNHLTASDVVFSTEECNKFGSQPKVLYIKSAEAIDDYTVEFKFDVDVSATAGLWEEIMTSYYIVTQAAYEASEDGMATTPVSTSPYQVKEFVVGSHVTVENVGNWQKDESLIPYQYLTNVDEIKFDFIPEASQIAMALQTGDINMTTSVGTADLDYFREGGQYADQYEVTSIKANQSYYLLYNCAENSVMNNISLRRAIAYCFNADDIISAVFNGEGEPCKAPCGNDKYSDYIEAWDSEDYFEYDLDTAKEYLDQYLAETGKSAGDVTVRLLVSTGEGSSPDICEVLQGEIMALGIKCELLTYEAAVASDLVTQKDAWDLYVGKQGSTTNMVSIWPNLISRDTTAWGDSSMGFVQDDKLEELLKTAINVETHTEENIQPLKDYIDEQCYLVGICNTFDHIVAAKWVTSLQTDMRIMIMPGGCTYDWELKEN